MNIAFYAPLKSPDSPVPSGDRLIGRMLLAALAEGGHNVVSAARLRSFDGGGNAARQARLQRIGGGAATRLLRRWDRAGYRPDLWLTYHLYHKAPDWIGPPVARTLAIPYCVVEASSSARAAVGPWAAGHAAVQLALAQAALVISLNPKDEPGLRPLVGPTTRMSRLAPFIDGRSARDAVGTRDGTRARLIEAYGLAGDMPWLIAVGMLRPGDKAASYAVLAAALAQLGERSWQLLIVGGGSARADIEPLFAAFGRQALFLGELPSFDVARLLAACDILVWPAINEAIGMVFIEAAMAGLPVVAASRPGIAAIVRDGETGFLVPEGDASAFAMAASRLLDEPALRWRMGVAAAKHAATHHDLSTAGALFCRELEAAVQ